MHTIVIANQKGGVAKTTTAVTLAHGLALKGKTTLLLDLDPQGQCASALGHDPAPGVFNWLVSEFPLDAVVIPAATETDPRPHLNLLPGNKRTGTAQIVLTSDSSYQIGTIATLLRKQARAYDYVVIDTSPSVGTLQEFGLYAADHLIIPVATDFLAVEGVAGVLDTLQAVRGKGGRAQVLGILPTFFDNTKESRANLDTLQERFADQVLPPIHRATVLREAAAEGRTIWEKDPNGRAAEEYANLVWRVIHAK